MLRELSVVCYGAYAGNSGPCAVTFRDENKLHTVEVYASRWQGRVRWTAHPSPAASRLAGYATDAPQLWDALVTRALQQAPRAV